MYEYNANVTGVYDGDSITVDIDLGFGIWMKKQKIRLVGINTPELRGEERESGLAARDFLREQILNKSVILKTYKDSKGKYGRWLAEVWLPENLLDLSPPLNINELLITEGHAERYNP